MRARRGIAARYIKAIISVKKKVRVPFTYAPFTYASRYEKGGCDDRRSGERRQRDRRSGSLSRARLAGEKFSRGVSRIRQAHRPDRVDGVRSQADSLRCPRREPAHARRAAARPRSALRDQPLLARARRCKV